MGCNKCTLCYLPQWEPWWLWHRNLCVSGAAGLASILEASLPSAPAELCLEAPFAGFCATAGTHSSWPCWSYGTPVWLASEAFSCSFHNSWGFCHLDPWLSCHSCNLEWHLCAIPTCLHLAHVPLILLHCGCLTTSRTPSCPWWSWPGVHCSHCNLLGFDLLNLLAGLSGSLVEGYQPQLLVDVDSPTKTCGPLQESKGQVQAGIKVVCVELIPLVQKAVLVHHLHHGCTNPNNSGAMLDRAFSKLQHGLVTDIWSVTGHFVTQFLVMWGPCVKPKCWCACSFQINHCTMMDIRVTSAWSRRRGLGILLLNRTYRLQLKAERQWQLWHHARHIACHLSWLRFDTLEDFCILRHLRCKLDNIILLPVSSGSEEVRCMYFPIKHSQGNKCEFSIIFAWIDCYSDEEDSLKCTVNQTKHRLTFPMGA